MSTRLTRSLIAAEQSVMLVTIGKLYRNMLAQCYGVTAGHDGKIGATLKGIRAYADRNT